MAAMQKFKRSANKTDLGLTSVALDTTNFLKIASYTVPAQQMVTWGATEMVSGQPQGAVGYIALKTSAGADINGVIRLSIRNAPETQEVVVMEERSEKFRASVYDRTLGVLIPEFSIRAKQDSKLVITMKGDSAATIDVGQSTIVLPLTVYY